MHCLLYIYLFVEAYKIIEKALVCLANCERTLNVKPDCCGPIEDKVTDRSQLWVYWDFWSERTRGTPTGSVRSLQLTKFFLNWSNYCSSLSSEAVPVDMWVHCVHCLCPVDSASAMLSSQWLLHFSLATFSALSTWSFVQQVCHRKTTAAHH